MITTSLGNVPLESHGLGLGNLARYAQQVKPPQDDIIVEDYWIVIPSTLEPGDYPLRVRLDAPQPLWVEESPSTEASIELEPITITTKESKP